MKKLALLLALLLHVPAPAAVNAPVLNPKFYDSVRVGGATVWLRILTPDSSITVQGTIYMDSSGGLAIRGNWIDQIDSLIGSGQLTIIQGWKTDADAKLYFDSTNNYWVACDTAGNCTRIDSIGAGGAGEFSTTGTSVDNELVKFHGTTADTGQGSTSNQPTLSDAGLLRVPGGVNLANANLDSVDNANVQSIGDTTVAGYVRFVTGGDDTLLRFGIFADDSILVKTPVLTPTDSGATQLGRSSNPFEHFFTNQHYFYKNSGTDSWIKMTTEAPADDEVLAYEATGDSTKWVAQSGGAGTGDTLIVNAAGTEYSIVSNRIKAKSGAGISFTREDSTAFDVWRVAFDSGGVVVTRALRADSSTGGATRATFADSARAIDTAFAALKTRMLNLMGPFIDTTQLDTIKNAHHAVTADTATTALADANGASITAQYLPRVTFKDSLAASVDPHIGDYIDTTTLDTIQNAHKAVAADSALKASQDGAGNSITGTYETITNVALIGDDTTEFKRARDSVNAWDNAVLWWSNGSSTGTGTWDMSAVTADFTGAGSVTFDTKEIVVGEIDWPSTPFDVTEWFTNLYPTATDSVTVTHPVYRADSMFSFGAWTTKASDVVATIVGRFRLPAWAAAVDSVTITARRVGTAEVDSLVYFTAANVQAQPLTREAVSAGPYTSGVTVLTPTITGAGAGEWMSIRAYLDLDATGDSTMASVTVWLND